MITVRSFEEKDRSILEDCIADFQEYERVFEDDRRPGNEIAINYLILILNRASVNHGKLLVAEENGEILGYVSFWIQTDYGDDCLVLPTHLRLDNLYVRPQHRGKGIGQMFLNEVEDFGRKNEMPRILLNAITSNDLARSIYFKNGYRDYETTMVKKIS